MTGKIVFPFPSSASTEATAPPRILPSLFNTSRAWKCCGWFGEEILSGYIVENTPTLRRIVNHSQARLNCRQGQCTGIPTQSEH
jgi:hypothetical protein